MRRWERATATPKGTRSDGSEIRGMTGSGRSPRRCVDEAMLVKVETDVPPEQLALIGCGVTTGVGAALNTAQVQPGATVAVIGCGGVGQSVIQGAHRRRVTHLRRRPRRAQAQDRRAVRRHRPDRPGRRRPRRAGGGRHAGPRRRYAFEVIGLPRDHRAGLLHGPPGGGGGRGHAGVGLFRHAARDGAVLREQAAARCMSAAPRCGDFPRS